MRPDAGPESLRKRASFSKAPPRCPASRGVFPQPWIGGKNEKAAGNPAAFPELEFGRYPPLKPLRTAPAVGITSGTGVPIVTTIPVAAHHAVVEAVVPPASAKPASHMGQDGKPALLALIQRLVQRVRRICDLLQGRRRGGHVVRAFSHPRYRVIRPLLRLRVHPRICPIHS